MRHFLRLTDFTPEELLSIWSLAEQLEAGKESPATSLPLRGKTVALFFPPSSIRTRVTFEKGIFQLGGHPILFPSDTLDKPEALADVSGYLAQWADCAVVRHRRLSLLAELAAPDHLPVVNAMTDSNHPCEVLSDLYALSRLRPDFLSLRYVFVGTGGNIGRAWAEAAAVLGLALTHCCPPGYELPGVPVEHSLSRAVENCDVVLTDALPSGTLPDFTGYRITQAVMSRANPGALLNPCPPFSRGEEVSADVVAGPHFVGYGFKRCLLWVQQAVLLTAMG